MLYYSKKQTILFIAIFFALSLFLASDAYAANRYVRQGATGSANGADWTNAYTNLPSMLTRGDTYYLADGAYIGTGFNTPISGTTYIYVKKCPSSTLLADACQSVSGWSNSYGDGQAVFGPTNIDASDTSLHPGYIEIDGQIDYGIKFTFPDLNPTGGGAGIILRMGPQTNGVKQFHIKHIEFAGPAGSTPYWHANSNTGIYLGGYPGPTPGLIVSHSSFHGASTPIQINGGWTDSIIEYNDFYDVRNTNPDMHTNILWVANGNNITIRYNKLHNYDTEGFLISGAYNGTWHIYGNLFYDGASNGGGSYPRGIELYNNINAAAVFYIYNNTCVDMNLACVRVMTSPPTLGAIRNNLGYGSGSGFWLNSIMPNSSNTVVSNSNVFVNYVARDFHLAAPTAAGYSLFSPYNVDRDVITRGVDGIWDIGAYEYIASGPQLDNISPSIPANLTAQAISSSQINLSWSASTDNVGVTGYRIYRNGTQISTSSVSSYSNTGLTASTTYSYTVSALDAAGNASSQSTAVQTTTFAAPPTTSYEAELCSLIAPMQIVSDVSASGGQYIQTSASESGTATCSFSVSQADTYKITARVFAPNGGTDSFYFQIDNSPEDTYDLNPTASPSEYNVWREDNLTKRGTGTFDNPQYDPYTINLSSGAHTLALRGRELNARLDYFYLTRVTDTTPPSAPQNLSVN